jgi:hypothetical protein
MINERKAVGEYRTLSKEIMDDEEKFFFYIFVYLNINLTSCWIKMKAMITEEDKVFKES